MRAYSMDLRDRAFRLLDAGLLPDAVAATAGERILGAALASAPP